MLKAVGGLYTVSLQIDLCAQKENVLPQIGTHDLRVNNSGDKKNYFHIMHKVGYIER